MSYARDYRPWFVWIGVILLFPVGLLFLLYKETATITVVLEPEGQGTLVQVTGTGEPGVQIAFEQMQV